MNRAEETAGLRRYVAFCGRLPLGVVEAEDVAAAYRAARSKWPQGRLGLIPWRAASRGLRRRMETAEQ